MKIASPTLKIKYVPFPSKFELVVELLELEAPIEPILEFPPRFLLVPLPPTKLRDRPPLLPPHNLAAADRTPLVALKVEDCPVGVKGTGLSLRCARVT